MADMVKRIQKKGAEYLQPGEQIRGACVVMSVGQFKKTVAFGAIGGAVGAAIGASGRNKQEAPAGSMAELFPAVRQSILAVSDQRWILFDQGSMTGGIKGISAEWPREQIHAIELEKRKMTSLLSLRFSDGSTAQLEAVKGSKPQRLVEAAAV